MGEHPASLSVVDDFYFMSLGTPVPSMTTPVFFVSSDVANELFNEIEKGQTPVVHFDFEAVHKSGQHHPLCLVDRGRNGA